MNSFDLSSYDSLSRKRFTEAVADVSRGEGEFWKMWGITWVFFSWERRKWLTWRRACLRSVKSQLCMWDGYHVFLIATLVYTRLLIDQIYQLIELTFDWLIDDAMFACLLDDLTLDFLLHQCDRRNQWIWTRIVYHPCIISEVTNQVC